MPKFEYTAKNYKGETIKGVIDAPRYKEAVTILKNKNYFLIKMEVQRIPIEATISKYKRIKTSDLAIFCRQFATTLNAGIPVLESLEILHKQMENKRFSKIIIDIYEIIQKGYSLSEALAFHSNVFPPLLIHMIEMGEISGTLDTVMEKIAKHFEKENKLHKKLQSAITYPIIVSILAIVIVIFMLTFVMPIFIGIFDNMEAELPTITQILIFVSEGIQSYWYLFILITFILIFLLNRYIKSEQGRYNIDKIKLRVPILGKIQYKVAISRFTYTMSTLLSSGIDLLQALNIVQKVMNNKYITKKLKIVEEEVRKGLGLANSIKNSRIFPPIVCKMIQVREDTGSLESILEKTADFYDEEVEISIVKMTTMLEPLIIVILGMIIGFIVIAMILPMFEMYSIIK